MDGLIPQGRAHVHQEHLDLGRRPVQPARQRRHADGLQAVEDHGGIEAAGHLEGGIAGPAANGHFPDVLGDVDEAGLGDEVVVVLHGHGLTPKER